MKWKVPAIIKIYEALGVIGDRRITVAGNDAKVESSSRGKSYEVKYDPETNSIAANDNGSYWQGYWGYPSIAFLSAEGIIPYEKRHAEALTGIPWKDINTQFKNDFKKTEEHVLGLAEKRGVVKDELRSEADRILAAIAKLDLNRLGKISKSPAGY